MIKRPFRLYLPNNQILQSADVIDQLPYVHIILDPDMTSIEWDLNNAVLISPNFYNTTVNPFSESIAPELHYRTGINMLEHLVQVLGCYYKDSILPVRDRYISFFTETGLSPVPLPNTQVYSNIQSIQRKLEAYNLPFRIPPNSPAPTRKLLEEIEHFGFSTPPPCLFETGTEPTLHSCFNTVSTIVVGTLSSTESPGHRCKVMHYLLTCILYHLGHNPYEHKDLLISALSLIFTNRALEVSPSKSTTASVQKPTVLSNSQALCYKTVKDLADHYFNTPLPEYLGVQPRFSPLIAGPTGCGKSFICKKIAGEMDASYFRITYGQWVPMGAKNGTPTILALCSFLQKHPKVVLHIDELDKWTSTYDGWSRAVSNDLWDVLERTMQLESVKTELNVPLIQERLNTSTFIIGSGTWQNVFEQAYEKGVGFTASSLPTEEDIRNLIHKSKFIAPELLARFHAKLCIITYPLKTETDSLLTRLGVTKLAHSLDQTVPDIDWSKKGFRALESAVSDLLLSQPSPEVVQKPLPLIVDEPNLAVPIITHEE
jgi:hypothetical protein